MILLNGIDYFTHWGLNKTAAIFAKGILKFTEKFYILILISPKFVSIDH